MKVNLDMKRYQIVKTKIALLVSRFDFHLEHSTTWKKSQTGLELWIKIIQITELQIMKILLYGHGIM